MHEIPTDIWNNKPVCESEILKDCSYEKLANAYDNSIVYNSYLAAEMLKDLSAFDYVGLNL